MHHNFTVEDQQINQDLEKPGDTATVTVTIRHTGVIESTANTTRDSAWLASCNPAPSVPVLLPARSHGLLRIPHSGDA